MYVNFLLCPDVDPQEEFWLDEASDIEDYSESPDSDSRPPSMPLEIEHQLSLYAPLAYWVVGFLFCLQKLFVENYIGY